MIQQSILFCTTKYCLNSSNCIFSTDPVVDISVVRHLTPSVPVCPDNHECCLCFTLKVVTYYLFALNKCKFLNVLLSFLILDSAHLRLSYFLTRSNRSMEFNDEQNQLSWADGHTKNKSGSAKGFCGRKMTAQVASQGEDASLSRSISQTHNPVCKPQYSVLCVSRIRRVLVRFRHRIPRCVPLKRNTFSNSSRSPKEQMSWSWEITEQTAEIDELWNS